ncbi:hypothetical protein, partial [Pararhodobacter sp. SW119]|uniref:hypothetical protein n=1 Tax=Pararhodobacter sp. SW119 TaxID=2780075 RepID=UPI001AE0431F
RTPVSQDNRKAIIWQMLDNTDLGFPETLARILGFSGYSADELAQESNQDPDWVRGLFERQDVFPDIAALRSIAKALGAPEPQFVGRTITYLLARQAEEELTD